MVERTRGLLAEKLLDVARGDGDGAHLPPAEDLERDRLAGAVGPEEPVERAAVAHVLAVDGEDDVPRLQARLLAGAAGEEPRDDHVILDRVAEDAEPGARGGRRRAARGVVVPHHLRDVGALVEERDPHLLGTEHHIVDGEDEARRVDDRAGAHALGAEDARRGMRLGDARLEMDRRREHPLDETDGGVHGPTLDARPAGRKPGRETSATRASVPNPKSATKFGGASTTLAALLLLGIAPTIPRRRALPAPPIHPRLWQRTPGPGH